MITSFEEIELFLHKIERQHIVDNDPNIGSYIRASLNFIESNKCEIKQIYSEKIYFVTKSKLYHALFRFFESKVLGIVNGNDYKQNKLIQSNHIEAVKNAFDIFLNSKCETSFIQSHFVMKFIFLCYQIEVAKNGVNIREEIVDKLIKIGMLTIRGHEQFIQNHPIFKPKQCYSGLSNLSIKFGKYILTMNRYYDLSKASKYILKNGIKYLKYGIRLRNKYSKHENETELTIKMDNYWKLGMGHLCSNKPNKAKTVLSVLVVLLKKLRNDPSYNELVLQVGYIKSGLKLYERSANYGRKCALKIKRLQWNENVLIGSTKMYGTNQYFQLYDNWLNNNDFWFILRNLALFQSCVVCKRKDKKLKICSSCKEVKYCSRKCQKIQWKTHKYICCV